jgi:hypothetical protein
MKKRLIEREIQKHGSKAGLSMEAILRATSSFSSDDLIEQEIEKRGSKAGPSMEAILRATSSFSSDDKGHLVGVMGTNNDSHFDLAHGNLEKDVNEGRRSGVWSILSNWFGGKHAHQEKHHEEWDQSDDKSLSHSNHIHSLHQQGNRTNDSRKESTTAFIPINSERIAVGDEVLEEHYTPVSNQKVWDISPRVETLHKVDDEEDFEERRPDPKRMALYVMSQMKHKKHKAKGEKQVLAEDDHSREIHQKYVEYYDSNGNLRLKKKKHLKASMPIWVQVESNNAMERGAGVSTGEASRTNSSIKNPWPMLQPNHPTNVSTAPTSSLDKGTSWKRPGRITTDFQSTPVAHLVRSDPPDYSIKEPQESSMTKKQQQHHHHHLPHSGVRLVKKNSTLAMMNKKSSKRNVATTTSSSREYGGRNIDTSPIVEMPVDSNESAMIIGSVCDDDYGGLELEWGMSV